MTPFRIGQGFDVHAFGEGDHVTLGGVRVPHERGIVAHSDGDVVLHALCDAMLGALALGDIGRHFPPSDARWKDADSRVFLRVEDQGPGIPKQYRESIFQPFFRLDKSRSRAYGGAGLGLALVWEIATLHGGTAEVESSSENGTVMLVTLSKGATT